MEHVMVHYKSGLIITDEMYGIMKMIYCMVYNNITTTRMGK